MFGKILGAVAGGIGGSSGGGGGSQTQTMTVQVPEWLDTQNKSLVDRAVNISNTPFTPYTDPRIAGFNQDFQDLFGRVRSTQNQFQPLVNKAITGADALMARSAGPTSDQLQGFMNPYTQNVIDATKRQQGVDFAQQNAQRARKQGLQNAFGNVATDLTNMEAERNFNTRMDDVQYRGLADAFSNAQNQFNQGTGTMQNALQSYLQAGQAGQQMTANDLNLLQQIADAQRTAEQQQLDFNYGEFERKLADPYDNLNFLAGIMNPMSSLYRGQTTQTTQPKAKSSGLGNILGAASTIGGLFGFADGGSVRNAAQQYSDALIKEKYGKRVMDNALSKVQKQTELPNVRGLSDLARFKMLSPTKQEQYITAKDTLSGLMNFPQYQPQKGMLDSLDRSIFGPVVDAGKMDVARAAATAELANRGSVGIPPIDESLLMDTPVSSMATPPFVADRKSTTRPTPVNTIGAAPGVDSGLLQQIFDRLGKEDTVDKPKVFGREINMPLLMAGLSMLGTRGGLTDKIAAGAQAGFGAYDEINAAEKAAYDKQTQDLMTMFDIQNKLEQQRVSNQQKAAKSRGKGSNSNKDRKAILDEVASITKTFGADSPEAINAKATATKILGLSEG